MNSGCLEALNPNGRCLSRNMTAPDSAVSTRSMIDGTETLIFDLDGTLVDSSGFEDECYVAALREALGICGSIRTGPGTGT